jgi:hypothetical protein
VTGPFDVIVRAEARNIDELGKLVVARVQAVVPAATAKTTTSVWTRTYAVTTGTDPLGSCRPRHPVEGRG